MNENLLLKKFLVWAPNKNVLIDLIFATHKKLNHKSLFANTMAVGFKILKTELIVQKKSNGIKILQSIFWLWVLKYPLGEKKLTKIFNFLFLIFKLLITGSACKYSP